MEHWRNMISIVLIVSASMAVLRLSDAHENSNDPNNPNAGPGNQPDDYIHMHNCIRRVLGLCPVWWDPELAKAAQAWADQRKDCQMIHSDRCGENMAAGPNCNGSWAVQMWLDERLDYDYGENKCLKMCGHYTQIVWKNTRYIGCGRTKCDPPDSPCYLVVCNYDPPGNVVGEHPY